MKLHQAANKHLKDLNIPFVGLAMLTENPPTWRVDFADEATQEQRAAAQAALQDFVPPEEKPPVDVEKLVALLESKGTLSKQDVAAARERKK